MALIVYPTDDWDTFIDVTESDSIITGMVQNDNTRAYLTLQVDQKEAVLRQTATQIRLCSNITLPEDNEGDLQLAQCYLTVHAMGVDMTAYDPNEKAVTYEKVGSLATAYQAGMKGSSTDFDSMTSSLLRQYGCSGQSSGFSQSKVARV